MVLKIAIFTISTITIGFISRASLASPRSHGFTRFLSWEAILCLFVLNLDGWFTDPFSWHQVLSWTLLAGSLVPLVLGVAKLKEQGRQEEGNREDSSLYRFEKTTRLVTDGIYGYIRHPLYSSLLLLVLGIFLKAPSLEGGGVMVVACILLIITALRDERECREYFGDGYRDYMKRTKRFIPFLF
ncbi:MAG: isoprenylcysteine carboxylmethyltransferase family protein [Spirochaetota bacterium]